MLSAKCEEIGLEFDGLFYDRCEKYTKLLQEWGKVHNLTASLEQKEIEENIIDSVYPLKFLNPFKSFADIGTGAGYPGMLLAIARPAVKAVLIEPKTKRVAFLNFVKNSLGLDNVQVLNKRAQEVPPQKYDLITSRAVTNTSLLLDLTKHISTDETEYLFYKGSVVESEIKEAELNRKYEIISVGNTRNYLYIKREELS